VLGSLRGGMGRVLPPGVRGAFSRRTLRKDATAGLLLGIESVPDGLASGLLAGVNPLSGVYAGLFGLVGAAGLTSSTFMAVQATGAMALIVADTDLASRPDPDRALFTLAMLTGLVMVVAGLLGAGSLLRFVPTAVMTGFVTAVGVNIVLGQLGDFTGYDAPGSNRLVRAAVLLTHPWRMHLPTLVVGVVTLVGIVVLQRTRLGPMGLVVAVVLGSGLAAGLVAVGQPVALVADLATVPNALPLPTLPTLGDLGALALPALSLAFVGMVQGAAVTSGVPNTDGRPADASRDFIGQGLGNVVAGVFRGMPVGGSMSASALIVAGGAMTRLALFVAAGVMALVVLLLAGLVALVAMPALAALLIVVGAEAVRPARITSVVKTGALQTTVMVVTFFLTVLIPVQYAVLTGVGLAIVLYVAEQSNRLTVRRVLVEPHGRLREVDPPDHLEPRTVVVLQPYGSLFFASAPLFAQKLPAVTPQTRRSVVVMRLRGVDQIGLSLIAVMRGYAEQLKRADSHLVLVLSDRRVLARLRDEGLVDLVGAERVYLGTEWLGETVRQAYTDAVADIERRPDHA
jgi:SulP family sulfate permease